MFDRLRHIGVAVVVIGLLTTSAAFIGTAAAGAWHGALEATEACVNHTDTQVQYALTEPGESWNVDKADMVVLASNHPEIFAVGLHVPFDVTYSPDPVTITAAQTVNLKVGWVGSGETQDPSASASPLPGCGLTIVHAKSISGHDCNPDEFGWVITQADEITPPPFITVTYDDNSVEVINLTKVTGGVAHYVTTNNLNHKAASGEASLSDSDYAAWTAANGQFNLSHGPCDEVTTTTVEQTTTTTEPETTTTTEPVTTTTVEQTTTTTAEQTTTTTDPVTTTSTVPETTTTEGVTTTTVGDTTTTAGDTTTTAGDTTTTVIDTTTVPQTTTTECVPPQSSTTVPAGIVVCSVLTTTIPGPHPPAAGSLPVTGLGTGYKLLALLGVVLIGVGVILAAISTRYRAKS